MIGKLSNTDVAKKLQRIGQLYQLKKDRWRARAFLNAAKIIEDLSDHVMQINLLEIEGIGNSVDAVIQDLCATGTCRKLERLEAEFPDAGLDLTWMPGIGPVKAQELSDRFGVTTMEGLLLALERAGLEGTDIFKRTMEGLSRKQQGRLSRFTVKPFVELLLSELQKCPHVERVEVAGSWRRKRLTVKDLDVLIGTDAGWHDEAVAESLRIAEKFGQVESAGKVKIRFRHIESLYSVSVDFLVADIDSWGAALCYFTGSKAHNERLRSIAKAIGLKVNEYGIFQGEIRIGGAEEADLYRILDLEYLDPEDRED